MIASESLLYRGGLWEDIIFACFITAPGLIILSVLSLGLFQYIDDAIPAESPYLYGLHPNAEIGFLTQTSEKLFRTVLEMQPRDGGSGEGTGGSRDDKVLKDYTHIGIALIPQIFTLDLKHKI